jgi:hypothetical protein
MVIKHQEKISKGKMPAFARGRIAKASSRFGNSALAIAICAIGSSEAIANGYGESSPWQFESAQERSVNLSAVDVMERKRGGYYDGFTTTVYNSNVTNIGSQVNCSNVATAIGNEASNSQVGNSINTDQLGTVSSQSAGNSNLNDVGYGGGTAGADQANSGSLASSVTGSTVGLSNGSGTNGSSRNYLLNDQYNSGNQTAGVDSSIACDMTGATITGNVDGSNSGQVLNGLGGNSP